MFKSAAPKLIILAGLAATFGASSPALADDAPEGGKRKCITEYTGEERGPQTQGRWIKNEEKAGKCGIMGLEPSQKPEFNPDCYRMTDRGLINVCKQKP